MARVAFLVAAEGIEQVELTEPWKAVQEAGHTPVLLSPDTGSVQAFNHLDKADTFDVDLAVARADVDDYAALVLPGGVANPDALRTDPGAVDFVRRFTASGRPVAAICHAPWVLAEADVLSGRRTTSWPSLRTDLTNAGAQWEDAELVECDHGPGPLMTSRDPATCPRSARPSSPRSADHEDGGGGRCPLRETSPRPGRGRHRATHG